MPLNKAKGNMYKKNYCQCGCGIEIPKYDNKNRLRKYVNGHTRKGKYKTLQEVFWNNIKINKNKCWVWRGYVDSKGYGRVFFKGKKYFAHRFMLIFKNIKIKNKEVCNKCDNPRCVNPEHLFIGNHRDNMIDCLKKDRWGSAKIKTKEIKEIIYKYQKGFLQKEIAIEYGVSQSQISRIINNKSWHFNPI